MDQPKSEHSAQTDKGYPHLPTQSGPVSQTYRFQVQSSASGCNAIRSLHHNTVVQSERLMRVLVNPLILFQTTPGGVFAVPQEIAGGGQSSLWDTDVVGAEISEVFILLCFGCCGRFWLGGRSSLCRCTPAIDGCHPRRGAFRFAARPSQFVLAFFGEPSSERGVGVCPDLRAVAS